MPFITPSQACDILNQLLAKDYDAISTVLKNRVACNEQIHPDKVISVLGVINLLFQKNVIYYTIDKNQEVTRFYSTTDPGK